MKVDMPLNKETKPYLTNYCVYICSNEKKKID